MFPISWAVFFFRDLQKSLYSMSNVLKPRISLKKKKIRLYVWFTGWLSVYIYSKSGSTTGKKKSNEMITTLMRNGVVLVEIWKRKW